MGRFPLEQGAGEAEPRRIAQVGWYGAAERLDVGFQLEPEISEPPRHRELLMFSGTGEHDGRRPQRGMPAHHLVGNGGALDRRRSEERRVGKEWSSRWTGEHERRDVKR